MRIAIRSAVAVIAVLGLWPAAAFGQSVSLDYVDGQQGPDSIVSGQEVVFSIRLATGDTTYWGINNGFRIYSEEGVEWDTVSGEWTNAIDSATFPMKFVPLHGVTGSGADTIGFGGLRWSEQTGIPPGFDSVAFTITIGPIDTTHEGRTICLDSSYYPPAGRWTWTPEYFTPNTLLRPSWDGPHCFTVAPPASCCEYRGDIDDSGSTPDIADYIYLIDYMFYGGPAAPCPEQADVDSNGTVADIADLVYLQDYMFAGGPAPGPCP